MKIDGFAIPGVVLLVAVVIAAWWIYKRKAMAG